MFLTGFSFYSGGLLFSLYFQPTIGLIPFHQPSNRHAPAPARPDAAHKHYSVQTDTPRRSRRRPLPFASPSPGWRSSAPARRSITTRCPSSAPHFAM